MFTARSSNARRLGRLRPDVLDDGAFDCGHRGSLRGDVGDAGSQHGHEKLQERRFLKCA